LKRVAQQANAHLPPDQHLDVSPNVLRHTLLRKVANEKGVHYAMELLGHRSDRYIWRYVRPDAQSLADWHFIVVRDPTVKHAISEVYEEARAAGPTPSAGGARQPLAAAPVLIVACVNTPASGRAGFQTGASIYSSMQNLLLAARALGLGSCLTTLHRRRKARIHAILGIPDHVESAAIIPLGWPDRDYGPNRRPPLAQFVMYDRWTGS
jgi:nitroreductase